MTDIDPLTDDALDAARSLMPVFIVAESPDGNVYSHSSGYPDDDTDVWVGNGDRPTTKLGDLYAQYGDDLIAYAQPEPVPVAAGLDSTGEIAEALTAEGLTDATIDGAPITAAQDAPKRTADGEVVINPDAPPDPKLALSEDVQQALNEIPARRKKAEDDGDTAEVEALDRYADALRSGKSPAEARKSAWADTPDAVTAAVAEPLPIVRPGDNPDAALAEGGADTVDEAELQARARYTAALAAGRSEADAREAGWPTRGQGPVTAAMAHDALDRIEDFLSDVEDMLGITAAMNGTGMVPLPVQRQAVGGNTDAQAFVVRVFSDNYRDDVNEFIEDVLGTRPPDGTPDHDADAWDALAAEARLWHARQTATVAASLAPVTAAYVPHRLGKGVEGGGRFAKVGDVGIPLLRKLLRGDGTARTEVAKAINDAADRGDIDMTNRSQNPVHWATKVFGPRPSGNDGLAWDAGRREVAAVLARRLASGATPGIFRKEDAGRPLNRTMVDADHPLRPQLWRGPQGNDRPESGVPTVITRDDLLARAAGDSARGQYTVAMRRPDGTETHLEVLHSDGNGSGYAMSRRTDQLYRFEQTGRAVRSNQVTVKVTPARDTGDQAGTLAFDGESQSGRINVALTRPAAPGGNDRPEVTPESMVARRVAGGGNPAEAQAMLDDLIEKHEGDNLASALVYNGFATEAQAHAFAKGRLAAPAGNDRPEQSLTEEAAPNSWAYVHLLRRLAADSEARAANPQPDSYVHDSATLLRGNAEMLRKAADRIETALRSTEPMTVQHRTIEADLKRRLDHMNNGITGDGERSQLMQMGNYGRDILVGAPDWLPGPPQATGSPAAAWHADGPTPITPNVGDRVSAVSGGSGVRSGVFVGRGDERFGGRAKLRSDDGREHDLTSDAAFYATEADAAEAAHRGVFDYADREFGHVPPPGGGWHDYQVEMRFKSGTGDDGTALVLANGSGSQNPGLVRARTPEEAVSKAQAVGSGWPTGWVRQNGDKGAPTLVNATVANGGTLVDPVTGQRTPAPGPRPTIDQIPARTPTATTEFTAPGKGDVKFGRKEYGMTDWSADHDPSSPWGYHGSVMQRDDGWVSTTRDGGYTTPQKSRLAAAAEAIRLDWESRNPDPAASVAAEQAKIDAERAASLEQRVAAWQEKVDAYNAVADRLGAPRHGTAPVGNDRPDTGEGDAPVKLTNPAPPTVDIDDLTPDKLRELDDTTSREALHGDGPGTEGEATVLVGDRRVRLEWADEATYRTSSTADVASRVWVNGIELDDVEVVDQGDGNEWDGHPVGGAMSKILASDAEDGDNYVYDQIIAAIRDAAAKSPTPPRRHQFDVATTVPVSTFTSGPNGERVPGPDIRPSKRLTVRPQRDGTAIVHDAGGDGRHTDDPEFLAAIEAIHPDGAAAPAPAGNDRPDDATRPRFADAPVGTIVSVPSTGLIGGRNEFVRVAEADGGGWERVDADGQPTGGGYRPDVPDSAEVFSAPGGWQPSRPQSPFGGFAPLRFADAPEGTKVRTGPRTWTKKGDVWASRDRTLDVPANSSTLVSAPDGWTPADYQTHPDAAALERLAGRETSGGYATRALEYARDPNPERYSKDWDAQVLRRDAKGLRGVPLTGNKADKAAQAAAIDRVAAAWERRADELDPPRPAGPPPEFSPNARDGRPGSAAPSVGGPLFDDTPVEDMTVGQLLGVDRSPDHIRALLKRGDLTNSQRSDLRALLDSGAVRAALDLAASLAPTADA